MSSLTRSTLVTRISQLIGDPSDKLFTAAQKQAEIEKAQEAFVLDTRCLKDVQSVTVVAGTSAYALPTDIMDVLRVAHKGIKIESVSAYELDVLKNRDWTADVGTPIAYYVDLDPNNKYLNLYPIPQSADAGANLTVEYLKMPPTLSSDSSVPLDAHTLLIPYHDALAYWAASSLLYVRPSQEGLVMAGNYTKKYNEYVDKCIDNFRAMGEKRPINLFRGRNPVNLGT